MTARTAELVPYSNNARTHTPDQVNQIAASIREFGFTNPILDAEPEGGNRLIVGDATSADVVIRLMRGEQADLCFTSPPYAQQRDYKSGPQDWDMLMQGVFSILPNDRGPQ